MVMSIEVSNRLFIAGLVKPSNAIEKGLPEVKVAILMTRIYRGVSWLIPEEVAIHLTAVIPDNNEKPVPM
jgi:hypothetical protein